MDAGTPTSRNTSERKDGLGQAADELILFLACNRGVFHIRQLSDPRRSPLSHAAIAFGSLGHDCHVPNGSMACCLFLRWMSLTGRDALAISDFRRPPEPWF